MSLAVFDWTALDVETQQWLDKKTRAIKERTELSAKKLVEVGKDLIEVRDRLGDGQFTSWLHKEFGWSRSAAYRFINVADRFGADLKLIEDNFGASALYILAEPSMPQAAVDEAITLATNGEHVGHSVAQEIKERHTEKKPGKKPNKAGNTKLEHPSQIGTTTEQVQLSKANGVHQAEVVDDEPPEKPKPAKPEAPVMTDDSGKTPVPASLAKFFVQRLNFKSATDQLIPRLKEELLIIARGPFSAHIKKFKYDFPKYQEQLDSIHKVLGVLCPSKVCHKCDGKGKMKDGTECGRCDGRGLYGY